MTFLPDAESLFQHAACGLLLCAPDGLILKANATFCGWLGYAEYELVSEKKLQDLLSVGGRVFHQTHWRPLMQVQGSVSELLLDVRQHQGGKLPMLFNAVRREHAGVQYDEIAVFVATDRRKYEQHLQLARSDASALNAQLAAADRRKDEFLATLAHELRNPLAPMRNVLEVLNLARLDDPQLNWARDVLGRQVSHMTHLVDDLMEVSRITQGRLQLRRQSVELAPVLDMALHSVETIALQAGHRIHVQQPPDPVWLDADATRLSQMVANLLTNAVKYTPPQGQIWLTVAPLADEVLVTVRDSGIGIAPEHLLTVFDMFSQLEPALSRAQGGLGIGLSLVRGLAELHGGSICARSAGVGPGREFELRLPLPPSAAAQAPVAAPAEGQLQAGTRNGKVLVIDDNLDAADTLSMALEILGYTVQTSYDGPTGIALAQSFMPSVILLDIGLPDMNGYEVARYLRGTDFGAAAILVAVTGWGQDKDRQLALGAGFDLHLTKPVDFRELDTVLQKMLAGR